MVVQETERGTERLGSGDARSVVREGLRRVVAAHGEPPTDPAAARAWQNRLLDETGSDRRGLVQLLLRVRSDGLLAELPVGPLSPAAWAPVRARLAFDYASATYLDADMARWALDAWAYARGVITADGLWAPPAPPPAVTPVVATPPAPTARPLGTLTPVAPPPALPVGRGGKVPGRVRRAVARANAPPVQNPFPPNFDRLVGGAFMGLLVLSAGAMWVGIVARREAGGLEVDAPPPARATSGVLAPLPPAVPTRRGAAATPAGVRGLEGGVASQDTLRLRDGTIRTGRVTRITHEAVLLRDLWSDTVSAVDLDDVVELHTRPGAVVAVGGPDAALLRDPLGRVHEIGASEPDAPTAAAAAPRTGAPAAGFGGRYTVRQQLVEVQGTESCDAVASAVRRASERPTVEVVAHRAGSTTFTLVSRPGVRGTVDPDGRFRTEAIRGVRDGVHYWFRMTGQFEGAGFRAETESATDAVLRYGSVQRCRVTAALDGRRLP